MEDDQFVFSRAANAIVVSPSGQLLVLIGGEWPERPERSLQPDLVGGSVEKGETITFLDLMRRGIQGKYQLKEQGDE